MVNFAHHAMSPVPCPTPIRPLIDGTFPKNAVSEVKSRSEFKIRPPKVLSHFEYRTKPPSRYP